MWADDRDHVLADMNGSCAFLYVVLRNKVKLAVRRRTGREQGRARLPGRSTRAEPGAAYAGRAVEGAGHRARARGKQPRPATQAACSHLRHEAEEAGAPLRAFFEGKGAGVLASA